MRNRWNADEAATHEGPLAQCVYATRLLGADRTVVAHGGGNTSVKVPETDLYGDPVDVLYVKGSGWDLDAMEAEGFAALDLARVRRLADLADLPDSVMLNELLQARLDPTAPSPSVETIVHALLPATAVLHTHPNSLLAMSNTEGGEDRIRELYGESVVIVPYAMPGFHAAKAVAEALRDGLPEACAGIVLLHHGLVSFGDTPEQAYDRMVDLVSLADDYVAHNAKQPAPVDRAQPLVDRVALAQLRREVADAAGTPVILRRHRDQASWAFSQRGDLSIVARQGVATPDHAIWTKPLPMIGRDVAAFAAEYAAYVDEHADGRSVRRRDPAPRVILDRDLGLVTAGPNVASEEAAAEIYLQIIDTIEKAEGLGGYRALPAQDIFDLEYWELEQLKLDRVRPGGEFTGEVAVVTGANSGIGRGCALALLERGAAVIGFDIDPTVPAMTDHPAYVGIACDVSSSDDLARALDAGVERFGGVDMVVASAGVFPESNPIAQHDPRAWHRAMSVNVDGLIQLFALVHPLLKLAPKGGRVGVVGSKNVPAPGPGASAYSASKAAANQIARVAALEWAKDHIRVNSVHPDAVFDTALWTPELLAERAKRYGMSIEDYKRRNMLGLEITSADVGNLVAATLSSQFRATTGAQITIDGGNERTI